MHNLTIKSSNNNYEVNFYNNVSDVFNSILDEKAFYIIDKKINELYKDCFLNKSKIVVKASERSKTLKYASKIFNQLIDKGYKSDVKLIVVGGGILQDLGGFIASTFCRGVEYLLIPTTLLSMCDSCIGGKTSINHHHRKNILGSFYPPKEIKITLEFLKTLKKEDLLSGYGELIKFYCLDNNINNLNLNDLKTCIFYGLNKKSKIIQIDEFDKGIRKLLNFGHTFGHALESSSGYKIPHGSAVILGILIANEVSFNLGYCSEFYNKKIRNKILQHVKHLKINKKWFNLNNLLSYIKSDKKNTGKNINMILYKNGSYDVFPIKDIEVLKHSLNNVYEAFRLYN